MIYSLPQASISCSVGEEISILGKIRIQPEIDDDDKSLSGEIKLGMMIEIVDPPHAYIKLYMPDTYGCTLGKDLLYLVISEWGAEDTVEQNSVFVCKIAPHGTTADVIFGKWPQLEVDIDQIGDSAFNMFYSTAIDCTARFSAIGVNNYITDN